jgi:hypothetical protein
MSHSGSTLLVVLSFLLAGPAGASEPGNRIPIQPPSPRSRPAPAASEPRLVELSRFLEAPGRDEDRIRLWLRYNREARIIEQGARDFLDTLIDFTAELPAESLFHHEHLQLDAELISVVQEVVSLEEARKVLLEELGRRDPDHSLLTGERLAPWSPDGRLERDSLMGLAIARSGRAGPLGPELERLLGRLGSVDRRLASLELQLLPTAEESLGAALIGLSQREASLLEVVHALRFVRQQQRARLELRVFRELLLLELARQLGCSVEQLPWASVSPAG